ncbi:MAG: hypothetical protein DRP26_03300, partial [Candidatus Zixiibacteriota bacterium]
MNVYWRLLKYIKPHLALFVLAVICMFFLALTSGVSLTTIVPITNIVFEPNDTLSYSDTINYKTSFKDILKLDKKAILSVIGGKTRLDKLTRVGILLILIFLIKNIFFFGQKYLTVRVEQGIVRDIRNDVYLKYHSLPLSFFHGKRSGELISRLTNDVT